MVNSRRVDAATIAELSALVRNVPDFPQPGVLFRDISPVLRECFHGALDALQALISRQEWKQVDAIAGIDARGFILAAGLAARAGKGFVPIRKAGKLPPPVERREYRLEYGSNVLEMHRGAGRLLLIDDVLATGGTLRGAAELSLASGYIIVGMLVLIDLNIAPAPLWSGCEVRSVLRY
jgi:adenine phosphoribosyltransferase